MNNMSAGTKKAVLRYFETRGQSKLYSLFDGPMPTAAEVLAAMQDGTISAAIKGKISPAKLLAWLESRGSTRKANVDYIGSSLTFRGDETTLILPFGESQNIMTTEEQGAVTFAVALILNGSSTAGWADTDGTFAMFMSVGDIGSGADVEIPGAELTADNVFKPNNVELELNP